ncbi:putative odorant receptor 92a [Odontomachus brunneus]|uniref:putative odorant receptor 92a n=1 Tax=Odontomachus brunneus TaxID=486640 RepID=UPI0013F1DCA8|nr:putative odorant receptor 92a [Odontomachus brunneus]
MFSLLINRKNIAMLTDILTNKPCAPIESIEVEIQQKFDKLIETNTLHYAILVEVTCVSISIASLCTDYRKEKLTFRAWLPYDYSSTTLFHITYFHQLISLIVGSVLHVACDGLICGLLLHICCQIEILNYRLKQIIRNPEVLRHCVIQHNLIFKFAHLLNKKFRYTITFQFIVSMLVVCFTLYQLSKMSVKFVELGLYMSCMLTQIFLYCWYGNEVKLKGLQLINNIFEMEWFALEQSVKKDLLIITRRSTVPIQFTSAYVMPMNLESFVTVSTQKLAIFYFNTKCKCNIEFSLLKIRPRMILLLLQILKTSYSTYNILQRAQDTNLLTIFGCWRPDSCNSLYKRVAYNVYSIVMVVVLNSFMLSQFMDIVLTVDNAEDFSDNFFVLLAMFISCCKLFSMLINRKNIITLLDILAKKPCRPLRSNEMKIQYKFDKDIDLYQLTKTTSHAKHVEMTLYMICMLTQIFFYCWYGNEVKLKSYELIDDIFEMEWMALDENRKKSLIIIMRRAIVPIQITSAYVIPMNLESFMGVNEFMENFYMLLAMIVSCFKMFSLLINRKNIAMLTDILTKEPCAPIESIEVEIRQKFDKLIEFAHLMNKKFRFTITFQFMVSTLVVCFTLYQLSKTSAKFVELGLYMSCMLTQIFLYCWYGNEVKLKGLQLINNIFEIEWFALKQSVKRDLLTITRRSTVPIEFTSAYVIPMNLESFVTLLKTSYSTYNILQQAQDSSV